MTKHFGVVFRHSGTCMTEHTGYVCQRNAVCKRYGCCKSMAGSMRCNILTNAAEIGNFFQIAILLIFSSLYQ